MFESSIKRLQGDASKIRNFCLLAHVDHGKTTLADSLISLNGIISKPMAGQLRYMDSREDEITRGITMKTSSISLYARFSDSTDDEYLINLVDSPGHVDFSFETICASKVSDGCLVLVDVVDGVCSQTMTVLRQAYHERMATVLVLNKVDRLITELQMSPIEAYVHLNQILEQVNAIQVSFYQAEQAELDDPKPLTEEIESKILFDPRKNNVVFASAIHQWSFSIHDFASFYSSKLGMNTEKLQQYLWGEFYFDSKAKRVYKKGTKLMGVQFVFDLIWKIYEVTSQLDKDRISKLSEYLKIKLLPMELKSKDSKLLARRILSQFLPLPRTILRSVTKIIPSPLDSQAEKFERILKQFHVTDESGDIDENLLGALKTCNSKSKQVYAYVSKMIPNESLGSLAFSRVFCGTLRAGMEIYSFNPKSSGKPQSVKIDKLYILMGKEIIEVDHVPSGNLCGISGLQDTIARSATLCTELICPNMDHDKHIAPPILQVALDPVNPGDLEILEAGLEKLCVSDPCAEYVITEKGEHILFTAGELHLERCLKDMRDDFAKIEIHASNPIVPFRETIAKSEYPSISYFTKEKLQRFLGLSSSFEYGFDKDAGQLVSGSGDDIKLVISTFDLTNDEVWTTKDYSKDDSNGILYKYKSNALIILPITSLNTSIIAALKNAFQIVCEAGPLCAEPMQNIGCVLHELTGSPGTSKIITTFRDAFKTCIFHQFSMRLVTPMYSCNIQATSEVLGKVEQVINKHRGRIVSEELKEGTPFYHIVARIPMMESFGLCDGLRKKTSGSANPQLLFDGFETMDVDPFWVPYTEEELEDLGDLADRENLAKKFIDEVRLRKGLSTDRIRVVEKVKNMRN